MPAHRRPLLRLPGLLFLLALSGCRGAAPSDGAAGSATATPAPADVRAIATIRDVMNAVIDPSADFIWESVQIEATTAGTTRKAPATDDEWTAVRRHALAIAEAGNLLLMSGRAVAPADAAAPVAGSMDLPPAEIEKLLARDRAGWVLRAHGLQDAALTAVRAAERQDVDALLAAGETLDSACEACHSTFWYPAPK